MNKMMKGIVAAGLAATALVAGAVETPKPPVESEAAKNARLAWWREARFGMFIHWGVYSALAGSWNGKETRGIGEWIMENLEIPSAEYMKYAQQFNPVKYSPEDWVLLAQKTGMKYMVITSKHHEGFALFDSKVTDWDVVDATPWKKDLLAPLVEAAHKHGMKIGFYYSQAQDWHHPGGGSYKKKWDKSQEGDFAKYIQDIAIPQVRELLTNYGKIDIFWWDTPANMTPELAAPLFKLVHELQPGIITNNRLGGGFPGDSETPEQYIPATGMGRDFEVCMTLNDTWGYKAQDHNWKSPERVIKNLVDIASKGGNYILNMGPKADGSIPQPIVDCFGEVGKWMQVNGEAIYGTTASPFKKQLSWGRVTKKVSADGAKLYLHVFEWPENGELLLPGLRNEASSAAMLGDAASVTTAQSEKGLTVTVKGRKAGNLERPEVIALNIKGALVVEAVTPEYAGDKDFALDFADADLTGGVKTENKHGKTNLGFWLNAADTASWTFKVAKAGKFTFTAPVASEGDSQIELLQDGVSKGTVSVPKTGAYETFRDGVAFGTVELPAGKAVKLTLRPVKGKWSPLNLRAPVLKIAQ
jgi:alpha-L-fucosidase